ncbi:MAG: hypothetical protein NC489_32495 [Ruminococcus flavefaciens]|nr:hypothetical protein [Ruminococcus flavefaciens]
MMTDLMDTFYYCVSKAIVEEMLNEDGEYCLRTSRQDAEIKRLNALLDEGAALRVDDLLVEQLAIGELRESAHFRAGFRLAMELTR